MRRDSDGCLVSSNSSELRTELVMLRADADADNKSTY